jgi:hypothetical protein
VTGKELADLVAKGCVKFLTPLRDRVTSAEERVELHDRAVASLELRCSELERKLSELKAS